MEWTLGTFDWSLIATIFFGALSGYIASRILGGDGFGFFGNITVGVLGGFIGSYLVKVAKIPLMHGFFGNLISSVGGALVLIFFIETIKYLRKSNQGSKRSKSRR